MYKWTCLFFLFFHTSNSLRVPSFPTEYNCDTIIKVNETITFLGHMYLSAINKSILLVPAPSKSVLMRLDAMQTFIFTQEGCIQKPMYQTLLMTQLSFLEAPGLQYLGKQVVNGME